MGFPEDEENSLFELQHRERRANPADGTFEEEEKVPGNLRGYESLATVHQVLPALFAYHLIMSDATFLLYHY